MFGSSCVPLVHERRVGRGDRRLGDRMLAADLIRLRARAVRAEDHRARVGDAGRAVRIGNRSAVDRVLRDRRVEGRRRGSRRSARRPGRASARDGTGAQAPPVVLREHRARGVRRVPSSVVLRTPKALSVMLLARWSTTHRADEPDAGAEAQVLVVLGVVAERVRVVVRRRSEDAPDGAPSPCTRFDDTVVSVICTVAPAVTRTPSWPKSGPVVTGSGGGIGVLPPDAWQSPTITGACRR